MPWLPALLAASRAQEGAENPSKSTGERSRSCARSPRAAAKEPTKNGNRFFCAPCDKWLTGKKQYDEHLLGKKHVEAAAAATRARAKGAAKKRNTSTSSKAANSAKRSGDIGDTTVNKRLRKGADTGDTEVCQPEEGAEDASGEEIDLDNMASNADAEDAAFEGAYCGDDDSFHNGEVYEGKVVTWDRVKKFGSVRCKETHELFGTDVFLGIKRHNQELTFRSGQRIRFATARGPKGVEAMYLAEGDADILGEDTEISEGAAEEELDDKDRGKELQKKPASKKGRYHGDDPSFHTGKVYEGKIVRFEPKRKNGVVLCKETNDLFGNRVFITQHRNQGHRLANNAKISFTTFRGRLGPEARIVGPGGEQSVQCDGVGGVAIPIQAPVEPGIAQYLPEFVMRKRVLVPTKDPNIFVVANSELCSEAHGLGYRLSPKMEDKRKDKRFAKWGMEVTGELKNNWLKISTSV